MNRVGFIASTILVVLALMSSMLFVVDQRQFGVLYALGQIKEVITEPGLNFKQPPPFQNVTYIDKRLLTLDSTDTEPMLTAEKQRVVIDWYVRWRISDPSAYIRNVGLDERAGALHVMWEDLAEVRSIVVRENLRGTGVGHAVLEALLAKAESVGIKRVFCLTFETEFFGKHGFKEISDVPVDEVTFEQMVRSHDDGVAEFLDLARVKQNTLGNTRMLKNL